MSKASVNVSVDCRKRNKLHILFKNIVESTYVAIANVQDKIKEIAPVVHGEQASGSHGYRRLSRLLSLERAYETRINALEAAIDVFKSSQVNKV